MQTKSQPTIASQDKDKNEIFQRHFNRFWGDVGSIVVFKRPKRNKIRWKVLHVENDPDKITWTNGGTTPNYIQLEALIKDRTGKETKTTIWTCENKIQTTYQDTLKGTA